MFFRIKMFSQSTLFLVVAFPEDPGKSDLIFASFVRNFGQMIRGFQSAYNIQTVRDRQVFTVRH